MPEQVEMWWQRRQQSKGAPVPYAIGTYRTAWQRYPVLIRQYHPDLNHGVTLTQVPPAADVYLVWVCDSGHRFVATPGEQRSRPGQTRRRSSWCPECSSAAADRARPARGAGAGQGSDADACSAVAYACGHPRDPDRVESVRTGRDALRPIPASLLPTDERCTLCQRLDNSELSRDDLLARVLPGSRHALAAETTTVRRYSWTCPNGHASFAARVEQIVSGTRCPVCRHAAAGAAAIRVGDAFVSRWAPAPASAAEPELRRRMQARLDIDLTSNAVRVARPFFTHVEVWPDIILADLRVAIEYDTTGRSGLEHVGRREDTDRRKDRLLRAVGWEVIRVRCGALQPIGPYDVPSAGVSDALVETILERLALIRGQLILDAYRQRDPPGDSV